MKPLKLHLDTLAVESFMTASGTGARGTVRGADYTLPGTTCVDSCVDSCMVCEIRTEHCDDPTPVPTQCCNTLNSCGVTCYYTCATCAPCNDSQMVCEPL